MARYRKRPVEIEAIHYDGHNDTEIRLWARIYDVTIATHHEGDPGKGWYLLIPTLEGVMRADIGDWIIRGVKNEFYPCRDDIFSATYDPVDA